jgi:hypothetical protein
MKAKFVMFRIRRSTVSVHKTSKRSVDNCLLLARSIHAHCTGLTNETARLSEVNPYGGGGSRINLNCFRTFLLLLCVLLVQMEIIGGGGSSPASDGLETVW